MRGGLWKLLGISSRIREVIQSRSFVIPGSSSGFQIVKVEAINFNHLRLLVVKRCKLQILMLGL